MTMGSAWVKENQKRQEFLEVLYRNQCRRNGALHRVVSGVGRERA